MLSVVELSALQAVEIQPDGVNLPLFVSIDRRPQKDVSYGKCVGLFWNVDLHATFIMATSSTGDRECPGHSELKFNYTRKERSERISGDEGKITADTVDVGLEDFDKKVNYKGKLWKFSILPNRITVKVPSQSDPDQLIEDSFCIAFIRNKDDEGKTLDKTLIACDDCSTLQKCVDTELPIKKPLSIGGKKVETTPHKKEASQRTH